MSEPLTPHGQHLHRFLCKFEEPHGCHTKETIAAVEAEAAAQERERLRLKAPTRCRCGDESLHASEATFAEWLLEDPDA